MTRGATYSLGVLAAVLFIGASPAAARACDRWGSVNIVNDSDVTNTVSMRLGTEGGWTDYKIPAHTTVSIYFRLDDDGRVPAPRISFTSTKGETRYYKLEFYEVEWKERFSGKPYKMEYDDQNGWDLFKAD